MESAVIALVVLAALLTGALLPLLFQARATLRSLARLADEAGPRLVRTLGSLDAAAGDVQRLTRAAAEGGPDLNAFFEAIAGLTTTLNQMRGALKTASAVGAAIGPAVVAAVNGYRAVRAADRNHTRAAPDGVDAPDGG
jgi:ABC-type transporter Mla subunit MlaD